MKHTVRLKVEHQISQDKLNFVKCKKLDFVKYNK